MSLSKLESLPNEILSDIIENYINGVDVLMGFSYQLNRRFSALITQSHRLHFNFLQCQKDEFCFCMGLLPAYIDKIEELAISEQDTPGQVHAFLSFFPSFVSFKRLRTLYFHFDGETVDLGMASRALRSLTNTTIEILSIKITNIGNVFSSGDPFVELLRLKTLKRCCLVSDSTSINWEYLARVPSGIEYLTVSGIQCAFEDLHYIHQWAPHLKYLDIQVTNSTPSGFDQSKEGSRKNILPISELRTLILSFPVGNRITMDMLTQYLNTMPVLRRLEIETDNEFVHAAAWEMLFETSLPLLTHFTLRTTRSRPRNVKPNVQASFQSSFWVAKKNFKIMITDLKGFGFDGYDIHTRQRGNRYDTAIPITHLQIAPDRTVNGGFTTVNEITSLKLPALCDSVLCHCYFDNVKCLTVDDMDRSQLEWMTTYINCLRIRELTITLSYKNTNELSSLLAWVPNVRTLHVSFDLLMANKDAFMKKDNYLKRLDISVSKHTFNEDDIIVIAKLFPYVEHIQINTVSLNNIPLLKTYLPHLHSLTFELEYDESDLDYNYFNADEFYKQTRIYKLTQETKFLFQYKQNMVTIWIDQATYEDPYWQTFNENKSQLVSASNTSATGASSDNNKKKKHKFSFLNWFK